MRTLEILDRGVDQDFASTWTFQQNLVQAKVADPSIADTLILLEHSPVYTTGRGVAFQENLPGKAADLRWIEVNRGGQSTYHGPGQLIAYPIFDLTRHGKDVHVFLRNIEQAIILTLRDFGIEGFMREGLTGVWVNDSEGALRKIASIGVGVSRWMSYHGLALNVTTDLSYFHAISPCGQDGAVMTSLEELLGERTPSMADVKRCLSVNFKDVFALDSKDGSRSIRREPLPPWLKVKAPGSNEWHETNDLVKRLRLNTVCEEAHCPNIGECWSHHTATFMIMGELCTRRCSFCAVKDGTLTNLEPLDALEPYRVGKAVAELGLKHVVITSVDRDDVSDMGASHFDKTIRFIRELSPETVIELLIPDMRGRRNLVETILQSGFVSVVNHNVETVPSLYKTVRPGSSFKRSLDILRWARAVSPALKTKSGVMLGLGEQKSEVLEVMDALREADVNIMTLGQYLRPTAKQLPVERYVTPEEFDEYKLEGLKRGFTHVESGPLVRSSYHAWKHVEDESALVSTPGKDFVQLPSR
jgi:lipoyl synthase